MLIATLSQRKFEIIQLEVATGRVSSKI